MKPREITKLAIIVMGIVIWSIIPGSQAMAENALKYSCSNQIYTAFSIEEVKAFSDIDDLRLCFRKTKSSLG